MIKRDDNILLRTLIFRLRLHYYNYTKKIFFGKRQINLDYTGIGLYNLLCKL